MELRELSDFYWIHKSVNISQVAGSALIMGVSGRTHLCRTPDSWSLIPQSLLFVILFNDTVLAARLCIIN